MISWIVRNGDKNLKQDSKTLRQFLGLFFLDFLCFGPKKESQSSESTRFMNKGKFCLKIRVIFYDKMTCEVQLCVKSANLKEGITAF